jgi:hypothetical protein
MTTTILDRVPLNSSAVAAAAYDHILAKLELDYCDGTRYSYSGVGPEIYSGLLTAVSKGWYVNRYIRGRFPYVKRHIEY